MSTPKFTPSPQVQFDSPAARKILQQCSVMGHLADRRGGAEYHFNGLSDPRETPINATDPSDNHEMSGLGIG